MEKKKLLLVAVSVGVVLLIMTGVPLLLLSPRRAEPQPWQTVPQANARPPDRIVAVDPAAAQDPPPVAQIPPAQPLPPPALPDPPPAGVTTITVAPPRTAAVPAAQPPARPPAQPAAQAARPPAQPAAQPARPPAQPAVVAPPAVGSNFWIQAGAFRNKLGAEYVRESLEAKGIASIIENRNINGHVYYRVRIGPYLSETEANYWLALVRSIDGFANSQVRVSQAVN